MIPTQADGLTTFTTPVYASPLAMTPAVSPLEDLPDGTPLPSTAEKISATYGAGIGGQIQFLPYLETPTRDTPEIRASLRQMLKDPYVKAAWLTQCFSVARNKFQVHAYKEDDQGAAEQAEFITDGINRLFLGFAGLALSVLMPLGPDGVSIVEPVTEVEEMGRWRGYWVPSKAKSKDLETLYLLGDRWRNLESIRSVRTPELGSIDAEEFLVSRYAPMFDEVFGWAAFRSSYQAWWMLDTVRKLRAIHHEKRTSGTIVAKYKDKSNIPVLESMLRRLKSSTWATVPAEVELQLLELTKASDTDYGKFEDDKIRDIVVGITFAELQMLTSPNERGDTEVHQSQSQLPIWYLTRILEETINRQWVPRYINWNFLDVQGYPRVTVGGPDPKEIAGLIDLIQKAQTAGFDNLDRTYYAKALGLQLTDDPKKQLRPGGSQPPAGPMGAGLPGGDGQDGPPDMSAGDQFDPEDLGLFDDEDGAGFDDEGGQQFAEVSWTSFQGPMGGRGWKNSATGEVRYQAENPGGSGEGSGQNSNGSGATHNQDATTHNGSETSQNGAAATHNADAATHNGDGSGQTPAATGKPGVFGRVKSYANKVLDTKIGRLAQMAEHKLQIASHKTRDIAVKAAAARGATPEQTQRLAKSLALADFIGGYVTGAAAGAMAGPLAAKTAMFLPSVSAVYLAYSAAKSPLATWKAALDVVASSSADPRHLVREGKAAWSGGKLHAEGAAPAWVAKLAELASDADPEAAEFKTAVFLAALTAGSDPDAALALAENPPKPTTAAAVRKFAEAGFTGTITDSIGRKRSYVNGKQVRGNKESGQPRESSPKRGAAAGQSMAHVDRAVSIIENAKNATDADIEKLADSLNAMTTAQLGMLTLDRRRRPKGEVITSIIAKVRSKMESGKVKELGGDDVAKEHLAKIGSNPVPQAAIDEIRSVVAAMPYDKRKDYLNEIRMPYTYRRGTPEEVAAAAVHHIAKTNYMNSTPAAGESPVDHAIRHFPKLKAISDKLDIKNADSPVVKKLVSDLALLPHESLATMTGGGVRHYFGEGSIVGLDDMGHLKDVQPSGYEQGETFANAFGVFDGAGKKAVYGTGPNGSISMPVHEAAHAIDDALGITNGEATGNELAEHHKRLYNILGPYFQNGGPGGRRGKEEIFAEATATYLAVGRSVAVKDYDEPFIAWLESKIPGLKS